MTTFRLHDFLRIAWVSDLAKETWKPRLDAIQAAWPRVSLHALAAAETRCVLRLLPPPLIFRLQAEAKELDLAAVVLGTRGVATPAYLDAAATRTAGLDGHPFHYDIAIGSEGMCAHAMALWRERRYPEAHRLADVPECCLLAMERDIATQRSDVAWRYMGVETTATFSETAMADPLWFWANIGALGYAPCRLDCEKAGNERKRLVSLARRLGFSDEMDWLEEILAWPVQWTALHGIAEFKTPVVKSIWPTDVKHTKATLRYEGIRFPSVGARGLDFPFRSPSKPPLSSSRAFRRGMANQILGATD